MEDNDRLICTKTNYKHIYINKNHRTKTGFCYVFRMPDHYLKQKYIKAAVDIDKLVLYRDNFLKEHGIKL